MNRTTMVRPVHRTLLAAELLSWSLTILVLASQQPQIIDDTEVTHIRYFHVWINGSHSTPLNSNGTISSPSFPDTYFTQPTTHTYHLLHKSKHGRVKLNFSDFFLTPSSNYRDCGMLSADFLRIIDGTTSTVHCGQSRPHPYASSTRELTVEYHFAASNTVNHVSVFRAQYGFVSKMDAMQLWQDLRSGFYVQETEFSDAEYGQLYGSLSPVHRMRYVDYVWYIQSRPGTRVHMNIIDLQIGINTTFEIHDGISSASPLLLRVSGNHSEQYHSITSSQRAVYTRWTGFTDGWNKLRVVYTEASFQDANGHCPYNSFSCMSGVCIPGQRLCDRVPHCEQGEDEDMKHCQSVNNEGGRAINRRQSTDPIDLSDCHCENGGTCLLDEDSEDLSDDESVDTRCLCEGEFFGNRCEYMSKAKRHHLAAVIARCTCKNGGTCTPTSSGFGFVCACAPGFRGYDCSHNDSISNGASSPTEYGIAMGAAVVAVLLVMFGVALCICVILQYLRQQRDGPESPYSRTLSRDVYSVEGVDIAGLQMESVEPNDYIPPSYNQCMHNSPSSPEGDVFITPSQSSQFSVGSRWRIRTPESPPPTYDAILGFCKECSELALRNLAGSSKQQTPSSDRMDTMSGSSNYTTGNNTPIGHAQLPFPPRAMFSGATTSQSQTESPLEEFELRRVQST